MAEKDKPEVTQERIDAVKAAIPSDVYDALIKDAENERRKQYRASAPFRDIVSGKSPRRLAPKSSAKDRRLVPGALRHWRRVHGISYRDAQARVGYSTASSSWRHWESGFVCVPLDAEILTRAGWKRHDEVETGDETLGWNGSKLAWTPIEGVTHHQERETIELVSGNRSWHVRVTPEHTWSGTRHWYDRYQGSPHLCREMMIPSGGIYAHDRLRLAAEATDGELNIDPVQAGMLGWFFGDGTPRTKWLEHKDLPRRLARARLLLARARLHELGYMGFVLGLSQTARVALLDAFIAAKGGTHHNRNYPNAPGTRYFSQNEGSLLDAMTVCAYLCGYRPSPSQAGDHHLRVALTRPHIAGVSVKKLPGRTEDVWCPTTGLGTWTMRWERQVMLTGNSPPYETLLRIIAATGLGYWLDEETADVDPALRLEILQSAESDRRSRRRRKLSQKSDS